MKAFEFRLDQVLRWREVQATLQKSQLAVAAAARISAEAQLESLRGESRAEHNRVRESGLLVGNWAGYRARTERELTELAKRVLDTRNREAEAMIALREADRKARLLSRLRSKKFAVWQREFDRETDAFAHEVFLARAAAGRR